VLTFDAGLPAFAVAGRSSGYRAKRSRTSPLSAVDKRKSGCSQQDFDQTVKNDELAQVAQAERQGDAG
jgi:hypothetical protein